MFRDRRLSVLPSVMISVRELGTLSVAETVYFGLHQGLTGSSELGVGGGVSASCDEEHSELVVGGVAVASGGASA